MTIAQPYIKLIARRWLFHSARTDAYVRRISPVLTMKEPVRRRDEQLASVAVILGHKRDATVLLIRRSERENDPWSGHIAFPGGRVEKCDRRLRDTAVRETAEELGADLDNNSSFLGYLGTFKTRTRKMNVVACVFQAQSDLPISMNNEEVASYRWVPLRAFVSEKASSLYAIDRHGVKVTFPAFQVNDYLVWGLTERIIFNLIEFL